MEARIVETPAAPPRACICGSVTGPFVDTGFTTVDVYSIYVCGKCCASIGAAFGMATPEEVATLKDAVVDLEEELAIVKDSLEEARSPANRFVRLEDVLAHVTVEPAATAGTDAKRPD